MIEIKKSEVFERLLSYIPKGFYEKTTIPAGVPFTLRVEVDNYTGDEYLEVFENEILRNGYRLYSKECFFSFVAPKDTVILTFNLTRIRNTQNGPQKELLETLSVKTTNYSVFLEILANQFDEIYKELTEVLVGAVGGESNFAPKPINAGGNFEFWNEIKPIIVPVGSLPEVKKTNQFFNFYDRVFALKILEDLLALHISRVTGLSPSYFSVQVWFCPVSIKLSENPPVLGDGEVLATYLGGKIKVSSRYFALALFGWEFPELVVQPLEESDDFVTVLEFDPIGFSFQVKLSKVYGYRFAENLRQRVAKYYKGEEGFWYLETILPVVSSPKLISSDLPHPENFIQLTPTKFLLPDPSITEDVLESLLIEGTSLEVRLPIFKNFGVLESQILQQRATNHALDLIIFLQHLGEGEDDVPQQYLRLYRLPSPPSPITFNIPSRNAMGVPEKILILPTGYEVNVNSSNGSDPQLRFEYSVSAEFSHVFAAQGGIAFFDSSKLINDSFYLTTGSFPISEFSSGLYFMKIKKDTSNELFKLVWKQFLEINLDTINLRSFRKVGNRIFFAGNRFGDQFVLYELDDETGNILGTTYFGSPSTYHRFHGLIDKYALFFDWADTYSLVDCESSDVKYTFLDTEDVLDFISEPTDAGFRAFLFFRDGELYQLDYDKQRDSFTLSLLEKYIGFSGCYFYFGRFLKCDEVPVPRISYSFLYDTQWRIHYFAKETAFFPEELLFSSQIVPPKATGLAFDQDRYVNIFYRSSVLPIFCLLGKW